MVYNEKAKYYLGLVDEYEVSPDYDYYIWAGNFCVNGIDWCIQNGKNYEIVSDAWLEHEDFHKMYLYLDKVRDRMVVYLTDVLNGYHKSDYSEFKWRIALIYWLSWFIPCMYDKYLTIKRFANDGRIYHLNLYEPKCVGVSLDTFDFMNSVEDDFGLYKYMYSILLRHMTGIDNLKVTNQEVYKRIPMREYNYSPLPKHVKDFVDEYSRYKERTGEADEVVIQSAYIKFTLYKEIMEKKYGRISGYFTDYVSCVRKKLDADIDLDVRWRTLDREIVDEPDEFICLLYKTVCNFLPIVYVEEFDKLKAFALENYSRGLSPKVLVYDCEGYATNELFKIYMMNIDAENVHKVDIQHALPYNVGGLFWYHFAEFQICDEFLAINHQYTDNLHTKFTRMPYINFFRIDRNPYPGGKDILYTNYVFPQHRGIFNGFAWNWGKCIDGELEFFKMLDKEVLSELKIRMHPFHKAQWKHEERIKEVIPDIVFDQEPSFIKQSIRNTKLVISPILGDAVLEAIGLGKPAIVLYNPKYSYVELNGNYRDIEDMIRVGIIAETPERLAAIVNSIHSNVDEWWNEPGRQEIVKRIREKYVYFPENAKEIWVDKITSYID